MGRRMSELVWNDGMSVGIDAIDEDHKQIIAILAKLTATRCKNITNKVIEDVFSELETYVTLHFNREERLLEKAYYKDLVKHKASHQKFIKKLPILKQQWLTEDNGVCCEKILSFLNNWLVDHILKEDFDYVDALQNSTDPDVQALQKNDSNQVFSESKGSSENKKNGSLLAKFSRTIATKINLSKRVFMIAFVPVLGVLLLSLLVIKDNYQQYKNKMLLLSLNNIIMQVENVSHSLQAERGISSGLVSMYSPKLMSALAEQRVLTDKSVEKLFVLMNNETDFSVKYNIQSYFDSVRSSLKELAIHRQHLDSNAESFQEIYHAYTLLIKQLLSISENLSDVDMNSPLANNIMAINAILAFKEYMGQIRAIGMNRVISNDNGIFSQLDVSLLVGKQLHAINLFSTSANQQQIKDCAEFCHEAQYIALLEALFLEAMAKPTSQEKIDFWYDSMSGKINELKALSDGLTLNFEETLTAESDRLLAQYLAILFVLTVFLISMIFFSSVLNFSIINPIRRITHALNNMSHGNLTMHNNPITTNDEIGSIQTACEDLRRKLLKVGIFESVVDSQKKEIAHRKSQQEHFKVLAFTDALTGAVNRHQFNRVLDDEISRANFEQQDLSILMLDIDNFKNINDTFGHGVGDDVLVMFYNTCKKVARNDDVVARIGGEEFVIVLPKTNVQSAHQFAERLREKIQNITIEVDNKSFKFTVSIGVSQWQKNVFSGAVDFVADADRLLYKAKNQGRNKVMSGLI